MKANKDDIYSTLVPSLKDRFFQPQLNFEDEQQGEQKPRKPYLKYFAYAASLIVGLGVFGYLALTSYKYSARPENVYDIPVVRKDITPNRIVPLDPGGEKFSNQDKLIYNNLMDKSAESVGAADVELRTPPEAPKPKIEPKTEVKVETKPEIKPEPKVEAKVEPVKKQQAQTKPKPVPLAKDDTKKVEVAPKTKIAKKPKKIDNPFDILDDEVSALDSNKLESN